MNDAKYQLPAEERHYKKTYSMTYEVVQFLRTRYNKSATVDQSVRTSKEFKAWQRDRKGGTQPQLI